MDEIEYNIISVVLHDKHVLLDFLAIHYLTIVQT